MEPVLKCIICAEILDSKCTLLAKSEVKPISLFLKSTMSLSCSEDPIPMCRLCELPFQAFKDGLKQLTFRLSLRGNSESGEKEAMKQFKLSSNGADQNPLQVHFLDTPANHSSSIYPPPSDDIGYASHFVALKTDEGDLRDLLLHSENYYLILRGSLQLSIWSPSAAERRQLSEQYHCQPCSSNFPSKKELIHHFRFFNHSPQETQEEVEKDICEICEAKQGEVNLKKSFKCEVCQKDLSRKASLLEHMQRHKGVRDRECPVCHKMFYATSLWRHMSSVHPQENKLSHKCASCPQTFAQRYKLKNHEKTHLPYDERPFVCDKCSGKRFSSIHRLKSHIRNIHGCDLDTHLCRYCGLTFSSSSAMDDHQRTAHDPQEDSSSTTPVIKASLHSGGECSRFVKGVTERGSFEIKYTDNPSKEDPSFPPFPREMPPHDESQSVFPCDCCNRMFKTEKARSLHLNKSAHFKDKAFDCGSCEAKFSSPSYLKDHERVHSDVKAFECSVCQNRFRTNRDLKRHFRTHSGEKPYKCNACDKRFASASNLCEHRTLHTGRLPYSCSICLKKFRLWSSLSKHRRRYHHSQPSSIGSELNKENQT